MLCHCESVYPVSCIVTRASVHPICAHGCAILASIVPNLQRIQTRTQARPGGHTAIREGALAGSRVARVRGTCIATPTISINLQTHYIMWPTTKPRCLAHYPLEAGVCVLYSCVRVRLATYKPGRRCSLAT